MTLDELKAEFKSQFNFQIDTFTEVDPKCAFGAGMLIILSALRKYDGSSLPLQIAAMHSALREVGEDRGWGVGKANKPE